MFCVIYRFPTHVAENNLFSFSLYSLTWYCICSEFGVHFFWKPQLWIAPSIGYHCVPFAKEKGKEEGKEKEKGERRKGKGERRKEMCVWCMRAFVWFVCVCACIWSRVDCPISVSFAWWTVLFTARCVHFMSPKVNCAIYSAQLVCVCVCMCVCVRFCVK